jgi:hypothetical protein
MGSGITYNKEMFNTEPLLNEINNIIKERLEEMLQEFMFNYRLFEENYNAVLNLPAFKHNRGTYKPLNVKKSKSNKKSKTTKKISIIRNLLEKNKLLQEELNKLKGVNIIDLTEEQDVIQNQFITVKLENENIKLNIEEDVSIEDSNDNICSDCECRVILDSDIKVVNGKKYCGACLPDEDDDDEEENSVKSLEEEDEESVASLEEESVASLEEESVASLEEESVASLEEEEETDAGLEEEEETDAGLEEEEETDAGLEEEEETDAGLEEEEEESLAGLEEADDVDTEASDEESVDETSNDLADKKEVVASAEEDEELFEIEIDDQTYCTNNEVNGFIYILDKDGDVGEKIGYFKDSDPIFYNEEN